MAHVTNPWSAFGDAGNTAPPQLSRQPTRFTGGPFPGSNVHHAVDSNGAMLLNAGSSQSRHSTQAQHQEGEIPASPSHHTSGVIIAPTQNSTPWASHYLQQHRPHHATSGVMIATNQHSCTPADGTPADGFQQSQNRSSYPATGVLMAAPADQSLPSDPFEQPAYATSHLTAGVLIAAPTDQSLPPDTFQAVHATSHPTAGGLVAAPTEHSPSTNRLQQPERAAAYARAGVTTDLSAQNHAPSDAHQHSLHAHPGVSQQHQHAAASGPSNGVAPRNAWAQQSDPALVDGSLHSLLQLLPYAVRAQVQSQLLRDEFCG